MTDDVKAAQLYNYIAKYGRIYGDTEAMVAARICHDHVLDKHGIASGVIITYPRKEADKGESQS